MAARALGVFSCAAYHLCNLAVAFVVDYFR